MQILYEVYNCYCMNIQFYMNEDHKDMHSMKLETKNVIPCKLINTEIRTSRFVTKDSFSYRSMRYESLFKKFLPGRHSSYIRLTGLQDTAYKIYKMRFSREADRASSDKTWSRLPVRRHSVGTAPVHTCYVISTTRLTRIRGEAGARPALPTVREKEIQIQSVVT